MGKDEPIDPLLGRVIAAKLEILELLGSGAMGKVYRAHHLALDKPVAIKVLQRMSGVDQQHALRFKAEARAASRLDHPNSVQVLDFGEDHDGLLYIAMEFLEGEDLQSVLGRERRIDSLRVAWIMSQVCAALAAAHQKGVIHRDMKPGNIMLIRKPSEDGAISDFVKVCDFGLAKILDAANDDSSSGPLTKQGAIFGTPAYMSPEQARGEPLDPRTDLYSCGCVMYKALTGQTPFQAESATGVLMKHITEEPPPISALVPTVDKRLEAIVTRAMKKDRAQRYPDAREMRNDLRRLLRESGFDVPSFTAAGIAGIAALADSGEISGDRFVGSAVATLTGDQHTPMMKDDPLAKTLPGRGPHAAAMPSAIAPESRTLQKIPAPLPRSPSEAHTLQTLPPPERTAPPPQGSRISPWLAVIPGSLALVLVGGLCVYVVMRNARAPVETRVMIEAPADPKASQPPPPAPETKPPVEAPATPPKTEPAPAATRPARARSSKQNASVKSAPPAAASSPEPAPAVEPKAEKKIADTTPEPPPPPKAPPEPTSSAPEPKPSGPKKLPSGYKLDFALTAVRVDGGISKRRSQDALDRHRAAAEACVRNAVTKIGVETSGAVEVTSTIDVQGHMKGLLASGALPGLDNCLSEVFSSARLPAPDTGEATIVLQLKYRASAE